ncbi:hypothetical protein [Radiobacillus sp. PE A8.2]|uniref:hypothetical protein n=1 Tax=Radiobacillus sp. PE A8.2 TaxID=3380349 RepID=UPI003891085B
MNKSYVIVIIILSSFVLSVFLVFKSNVSVIKFFPIDPSTTFTAVDTALNLRYETDQDEYEISWTASSTMDTPIYLRQDVSLLYIDGRLKGILSKWKEEEQNIELKSNIHGEDSSHYKAITFHHGEIHYPDDEIKSIQAMSHDELYVIDSPLTPLESFEQPGNTDQQEWKKTLDHATDQQLSYHWNQLIKYFSISENKYEFVPLTELYRYQTEPIPQLTLPETHQVIGQLWEGLYKNYILAISENNKPINSFIPLILFDKQGEHLLVLYQDQNGDKQQLIQYYPGAEPNA